MPSVNGRASVNLLKFVGMWVLLVVLLSFNYLEGTLSVAASATPVHLVVVAFADALLLSYFVVSSRLTGWREWGAVFALLYGMVYVLTTMETLYLGSILPTSVVLGLLVNGAISSAVFAGALVWTFGDRDAAVSTRLRMPGREWAWKVVASGFVYLLLFIVFGVLVYMPLAMALDPVAYAQEQSIASSAASMVFPIEFVRGALWALFAVPAVIALPFGWKKTGAVVGLLMAVPLTLSQFLSTAMTTGLQLAHTPELAGENLAFGFIVVWILSRRARLPAEESREPAGAAVQDPGVATAVDGRRMPVVRENPGARPPLRPSP